MFKSKKLLVFFMLCVFTIINSMPYFSYAAEVTETETQEGDDATLVLSADDLEGQDINELLSQYLNDSSTENNNSYLSNEEVIDGDQYIFENSVSLDQPINGNVYIFAQEVTINNIIDGNVFVCANKITVTENAYLYMSLYGAAKDIELNGPVYDLYAIAESINVGENGYVGRTANIGANNVNINGIIGSNCNVGCNNLSIGSEESDDILIGGDLNYSSATTQNINEELVKGNVNFNEISDTQENKSYIDVSSLISSFVYSFIVILVLVFAISKFANHTEKIMKNKLGLSVAFGALALILTPIVSVILLFTGIAAFAGIALLLIYFLAISICLPVLSVALGKIICTKMNKESKGFVLLFSTLVALVLHLIKLIPILNIFAVIAISLFGFGIIVFSIFPPKFENKKDKSEAVSKK